VAEEDMAWWEHLIPVRKLHTNVGARIRNCVSRALESVPGPPAVARERLEWSISKEVYKGHASGPTQGAGSNPLRCSGLFRYFSIGTVSLSLVQYMGRKAYAKRLERYTSVVVSLQRSSVQGRCVACPTGAAEVR